MDLDSRRNKPDELSALEPYEAPLVKVRQPVRQYYAQEQNRFLDYWRILSKRKWTVLATVAIVFAISLINALKTIPLYQATSKVAISPENPNVLGFKDQQSSFSPGDYDFDAALDRQRQRALGAFQRNGFRADRGGDALRQICRHFCDSRHK